MAIHDFCKDNTKRAYLISFAFLNFRNFGKFVALIERPKNQKCFSFRRLHRTPPNPRYRLALPRSPWGRPPDIADWNCHWTSAARFISLSCFFL